MVRNVNGVHGREPLHNDAPHGSDAFQLISALGCPGVHRGTARTTENDGRHIACGYRSRPSYFPLQQGARLPRKALMPSFASPARALMDITSLAYA